MANDTDTEGFDELEELLKQYEVNEEKVLKALEKGANMLVIDVRKLPRPRSSMNGRGYTHLINTVTSGRFKREIEVGWGKYYGPMVECGTRKMRGTPHIKTVFKRNKGKYYEAIEKELFR